MNDLSTTVKKCFTQDLDFQMKLLPPKVKIH